MTTPEEIQDPPVETPPEAKAEEPDYKALLEAEKARAEQEAAKREKLERDYASLRGSVRTQAIRDAEYAARMEGLSRQVAALAKGTGDEVVQREVAQAQGQVAQAEQTVAFQERWASLSDELKASLLDDDGKPVLDTATASELEPVRELYQEAYSGYDAQGQVLPPGARIARLEVAIRQAQKVVLQEERKKRRVPPEVKPEPKPAAKPPVPAMSIGPSAGAGAVQSDAEFMLAYGEGRAHDHERYRKIIDKKR